MSESSSSELLFCSGEVKSLDLLLYDLLECSEDLSDSSIELFLISSDVIESFKSNFLCFDFLLLKCCPFFVEVELLTPFWTFPFTFSCIWLLIYSSFCNSLNFSTINLMPLITNFFTTRFWSFSLGSINFSSILVLISKSIISEDTNIVITHKLTTRWFSLLLLANGTMKFNSCSTPVG